MKGSQGVMLTTSASNEPTGQGKHGQPYPQDILHCIKRTAFTYFFYFTTMSAPMAGIYLA